MFQRDPKRLNKYLLQRLWGSSQWVFFWRNFYFLGCWHIDLSSTKSMLLLMLRGRVTPPSVLPQKLLEPHPMALPQVGIVGWTSSGLADSGGIEMLSLKKQLEARVRMIAKHKGIAHNGLCMRPILFRGMPWTHGQLKALTMTLR